MPAEIFERDEGRFLRFVAEDYLRIFALGALAAVVLPACGYHPLALAVYAVVQGTLLVGPWELGHQCNHGAFSRHRWANDLLGAWLHTTLLMPYWAWQFSHAHHHRWPNHVYQGEGACPKVQGQGSRSGTMDNVERWLVGMGPEAWAAGHLLIVLVLGWWGYILFGVSGAPAWGAAGSSIFFAPNGMFPAEKPERLDRQRLSVALVLLWLGVLALTASATSPALVAALYFAPYLVCNVWLIIIVLLQHTKEDLPHFGGGEFAPDASRWSLEKGVFHGTVDRPAYGWLGRVLHHEAGTYHVVHHLFPQVPFYNSPAATEALDAALAARGYPGLRRVDETAIPQALWELGLLRREVAYAPETGDYRYLVAGGRGGGGPPPPPTASSGQSAGAAMITVKCFACQAPGAKLEPWSYDVPSEPAAGQVDVEISHCGVCGSDCHQIENAWGVASFPLVPGRAAGRPSSAATRWPSGSGGTCWPCSAGPSGTRTMPPCCDDSHPSPRDGSDVFDHGHEIVGKVVRLGPGIDHLAVGQRVGIGTQRGHCGACSCCSAGLEQVCPKITKTYGGPGNDRGGFAIFIRHNAAWTFPVPDALASESAAPLLCAGITTYSPIKRHCKPGMRVGILGIGGLGHIALQFARAMGCEVVAISKSDSKQAEAAEFGATAFLNSEKEDQMAAARGTLDFILHTASGVAGLDGYLALLRPRGVMACVGLPEKDKENMTRLFMQSFVLQEKSLVGSYLGPRGDYAEMLAFAAAHGVKPKVEILRLEQVNEAVAKVKAGTARYRMVLTV